MIIHTASPCAGSGSRALERTRFFGQQLVGPEDLTQDQIYFREKLRRHNRMMHGWGVVCGACVRRGPGNCSLVIEPGYILGPQGDEIVISENVEIDACSAGIDEAVGCCGPSVDPWCDDAQRRCAAGTVYLAVRFDECLARPVRSLAGNCGGGCADDDCEHSRIRDGFAWSLLSELPAGYTTPMRQPPLSTLEPCAHGRQRPCPPCPESPWVVLADVVVGADCRILSVDCFRHRRFALSFANYFLTCRPRFQFDGMVGDFAVESDTALAWARSLGGNALVDIGMARSEQPPAGSVAFLRSDGSTSTLPMYFSVRDGDTVESLLEREGERMYYDPGTDSRVSLREIFAGAGADPAASVSRVSDALGMLEGRTIDLAGLTPAREVLESTLTKEARDRLEREALGSPAMAANLPATALFGVGKRSPVGERIKDLSIGEVADLDRETFIAEVVAAAPESRRESEGKKALEAWEAAARVRGLARP